MPVGTTKDNFDFRGYPAQGRRRGSFRRRVRSYRLLGLALRDLRHLPQRAGCSSPATRRTAIRRMAPTASIPASRMPATSGWKLAAALQGWGGEALLDSYTAERQPVFASTAQRLHREVDRGGSRFPRRIRSRPRPRGIRARPGRNGQSGAKAEVDSFEPHYEGSAVVDGPPGGECTASGRICSSLAPGTIWRRRRCRPDAACSTRWAKASPCWPSTPVGERSGRSYRPRRPVGAADDGAGQPNGRTEALRCCLGSGAAGPVRCLGGGMTHPRAPHALVRQIVGG